MARSSECTEQYAQKVLDTAGIVREAMLRQRPKTECRILLDAAAAEVIHDVDRPCPFIQS